MSTFAVVIPAYNEGRTIRDVVTRCLAFVPDVIVVDDGSTDDTVRQLDGLPITLLRHERNLGKAASLWDGMQAALQRGARAVITLDGDGQHRPEDIPRLQVAWSETPQHIIIGARLADKAAIPAKRYYANRIANFWIAWAAGYPIADSQSGFRIYPASLLSRIRIDVGPEKGFVFESEILIRAAHCGVYSRPVAIPAIYARAARPSHFHGVRDIARITRMVAGQLLRRRMYLRGLYRSLFAPRDDQPQQIGLDGFAMLALSTGLILASAGVSWLALVWQVYRTARSARTDFGDCEAALLLGMRLQDRQPGHDYRQRLDQALRFLQRDPRHRVLLLGGVTGDSQESESAAGKRYLLERGAAAAAIHVEEKSRNTLENLRNARQAMQDWPGEVLLVSNRYHLARSSALARGLGIAHRLCAAEPRLHLSPAMLVTLLREGFLLHWYYTGSLFARWTGNRKMLTRIT